MRGIVGDPERLAVFDMVLTNHTPRTCSGERYGPVEVVRQMDGDLSGEGAGFWDGGSSVQAGVNQMQLKHLFPFPLARLLFPDGSPDDQATAGYADCIGRPAIGGDFVTSDLLPPDDRVARMLALASMRPSEITDASFRSRFLVLAHAKLPNVHFIQGDITDKNAVDAIRRRRDALGLGPARIAFLGTVLDQLGQGRVAQGIRNAMSLVGNGGKLIIAEFGQPDRRDPRKFSLLPHWGRYTYGYFAVHKDDGDGVIHPLIKFETSRPINGRVDGGLLDICGQLLPYREHLARAAGAAVTLRSVVRQPALSTLP